MEGKLYNPSHSCTSALAHEPQLSCMDAMQEVALIQATYQFRLLENRRVPRLRTRRQLVTNIKRTIREVSRVEEGNEVGGERHRVEGPVREHVRLCYTVCKIPIRTMMPMSTRIPVANWLKRAIETGAYRLHSFP